MQHLHIQILVLLMYSYGLIVQATHDASTEYQHTPSSIQDDLKWLNLSCEAYDRCTEKRSLRFTNDDTLNYHTCHCGPYCVQLDTCCLDSPYIAVPKPKVRPTCRSVYNGGRFFIMDRCPSSDSAWEGLCNEEWNGEDDIFKLMPVTSLQTSISYKNYFCFKCHETSEDFVHWTIDMSSNAIRQDYKAPNERISIKYDNYEETWTAVIDDYDTISFAVNISIKPPQNIVSLVKDCRADVISSCSEHWTDKEVLDKCEAYTAMKQTFRDGWAFTYKNIHCAACNFETIENFSCLEPPVRAFGAAGGMGGFSFTHLLDINRRDGDIVGKIQKCDEDYVWDPYARKCRKLTCALPRYSVQNGKCVAE